MSRNPEDDDHTYFIRIGGADESTDDAPIVSRAAFQLHSFGIVNSVEDGHPGFVSDDYLNAISAETTITAAELCTAGLWRRVDGGYEVLEPELVQMVVDQLRRYDENEKPCEMTGGHEPSGDEHSLCSKCRARID